MEVFLGTIMPVAFPFAPSGWAFCNGQLMSISQYSALFSLLGIQYGGDGVQTFALPDLRGRVAVGAQSPGPGISNVVMGEKAGTNNVTVLGTGTAVLNLTANNLPAHTHPATLSLTGVTATTAVNVSTGTTGVTTMSAGCGLSQSGGGPGSASIYTSTPTGPIALSDVTTTLAGDGTVTVGANATSGQPVTAAVQTQAQISVMQPYTGINYVIALNGIFPSRN